MPEEKKKDIEVDPEQPLMDFDLSNSEKAILKTKTKRELQDIVKNYKAYGYSEKFKDAAETLLETL